MSIDKPTTYIRKPFRVSSYRVTLTNIDKVAKWCGGRVAEGEKEGNLSRKLIKVPRFSKDPNKKLPDNEAHVGDWVVRSGSSYRVYNDKAFRRTFNHQDGSEISFEDVTPAKKGPSPKNMPKKKPKTEAIDLTRKLPEGITLETEMSGELIDSNIKLDS